MTTIPRRTTNLRSARNIVALATAITPLAALLAVNFAGTATAATPNPDPTVTATETNTPSEYPWGPFYAKNNKASAQGGYTVDLIPVGKGKYRTKVWVHGKLTNLDHGSGKCAYAELKLHLFKAKRWVWQDIKWCGAGDKEFAVRKRDVDAVKIRVSQSDKWGRHLFNKGDWNYVVSPE
ncbi:hypothetical protein [Acrocarpospora sp. B8E8]|uniref:hypothetical protein n=1 Tax=Acrocarpospora sp. B8E8 TaxID=3153572 RepID=UPI00325CB920